MNLSFSTAVSALVALVVAPSLAQVTVEQCRSEYLPNVLDCWENSEPGCNACPRLPIPVESQPSQIPNDMGFYLQHLRDTPTTHVFELGDFTYNSLIVVDVAEAEAERKNLRRLEGEIPEVPVEDIFDGIITIAIVDFPENYYMRDETGAVVGYMAIQAVLDILAQLGATLEDVASIEMIYSHAHMDHIGAANYSLNAVQGLGFEDVPIIASEGTLHYLEELIESGVSTYRAPLPTSTFDEKTEHTVGTHSKIMLEPVNGHQHDGRDVIIFVEAADDQPAIMMMVDVVFPKWAPFFRFAITTDLLAYTKVHEKMLTEYDLGEDGYFIGGHCKPCPLVPWNYSVPSLL